MSVDPVSLGIKVALTAASMALNSLNKIEGPRLDSLDVTTAEFGTPIPRFWGKRRLATQIIWAEKLREKKSTSKTKGGKYSEYKYYGTFACLITDLPIDAVTRIWMDKHLVYDATNVGPLASIIGMNLGLGRVPVKLSRGKNMRIYDGTQTTPDPRMEEWCEDRYGADSCPAYKGSSYIVFEELPLEKFGNRIPQVTVEAVSSASTSRPFETITPGAAIGPIFSKDFQRAVFHNTVDEDYSIWDVPTRTKIIDSTLPAHGEELTIDESGSLWGLGGTLNSILRLFSGDGTTVIAEVNIGTETERLTPLQGRVFLRPYAGAGSSYTVCDSERCTTVDLAFTPTTFFEDLDANIWAIGTSGTTLYFECIEGTAASFSLGTPGGVTSAFSSAFCNRDGNFFTVIGTTAFVVDAVAHTAGSTVSTGWVAQDVFDAMRQVMVGASSFFTITKEIDAQSLATIQTYALSDWTSGNTDDQTYDPINHALWGYSAGTGTRTLRYLDRVTSGTVTLATVIGDVADWCGASVDTSDLDQTVKGYSVTQGSGKDMVAPLLDVHDVDAGPHDFSLRFIKRGRAVSGTIPVSEFVREADEPRYQVSIKQDTDLPRRIALNFADSDKDQQTNTVVAQRPFDAMDGDREQQIDLTTYVATPGEAQKFVDRYFRRQWNERETITLSLTGQYLGAEPGDTYNLELDGAERFARLKKWTLSQGRIQTEWVRDALSFNTLSSGSGAELDGRDNEELYVAAPTKGFVKDIPLLTDEHSVTSTPLLYYGAGDYGSGSWPGAVIYQLDGADYDVWNGVDSADKSVWGYATTELASADPWLWDRGNTVTIDAKGVLTSCTEAQINADPTLNLALLGSELINFTTATLNGNGTYTLSGLRRGRRGTEWAIDSHEAGEEFLLCSELAIEGMGLSSVGLGLTFKAQTLLRDVTGAPSIEVAFSGANLKPYAPAGLEATHNATTNDWTITGKRRTRVGGAWVGGTEIPLSESSEAYEVAILNDAGDEVRELTVSISGDGDFTATYSAAQQTTDFGSAQAILHIVAYQISEQVGRGYPATLDAETELLATSAFTAGTPVSADNASVTPSNPAHTVGNTLLCVVICRGTAISASCATTGWTAADGVSNPTTMNSSRMWLFQNECDSSAESRPVITVSGGSAGNTVMAVVLKLPERDFAQNFTLGTVSANASNDNSIAFAQNSPSIDNNNGIIAIGCKNNNMITGENVGNITGITAGLDWTKLVNFDSTLGDDMSFSIDYAINDSGGAYTTGTSGTVAVNCVTGAVSAGVYLEVPIS